MSYLARWSFVARFGAKPEAIQLLQEWCKDIGPRAGLKDNYRIISSSVGSSESLVEFEMTLDSLTGLDDFFKGIPGQDHVAWGKKIAPFIVNGSTKWETFRVL